CEQSPFSILDRTCTAAPQLGDTLFNPTNCQSNTGQSTDGDLTRCPRSQKQPFLREQSPFPILEPTCTAEPQLCSSPRIVSQTPVNPLMGTSLGAHDLKNNVFSVNNPRFQF